MRPLSELEIAECRQIVNCKLKRFFGSELTYHDREDARSESMVQILAKLTNYDPSRGGYWNFVDQIATSAMLDQLRAQRRRRQPVSLNIVLAGEDNCEFASIIPDHVDHDHVIDLLDLGNDLETLLPKLNESERALIQAKLEGLTNQQAADKLGISKGTVTRRLKALGRKLKQLRKLE